MTKEINIGLSRLGGIALMAHEFKTAEARQEFTAAITKAKNYEALGIKARIIIDEIMKRGKYSKKDLQFKTAFE